jgi:hypothetical protein
MLSAAVNGDGPASGQRRTPEMRRALQALLLFVLGAAASAAAQEAKPEPLAPLAHWVGGQWVNTVKAASGEEVRVVRSYEWSLDRRVLIGRSFGERGGRRVQTRHTLFLWNPEARRIEFTDAMAEGGFGTGFVEVRDGGIYMEARITGNDRHPNWRAWVTSEADGAESFRIEAERQGEWAPFGTWTYRREP